MEIIVVKVASEKSEASESSFDQEELPPTEKRLRIRAKRKDN